MAKCIDVLDRPKEAGDQFALYISEQLKNLDKRWRLLVEKRIKISNLNFDSRNSGLLVERCILISILLIRSPFTQCAMFQFSLPQAMKNGFHNNNHSVEQMLRSTKNFKALYLVFVILCFCLKVLKIQFKSSTK